MPNNEDLYIILADYSHDLDSLKKRNGKMPADAAVDRIQAKLLEGRLTQLKELEEACSFYSDFHGDPDIGIYALEQSEIRRQIAQLQASAPTKKEEAHE